MSPELIHHNFFMQDSPSAFFRFSIPKIFLMVFSSSRGSMGTWMAWANEDPSKLLCKRACNFWIVMGCNPRTTMPFVNENPLSTWTVEGDFSFIFLHSWRNLRPLVHFIFLLILSYIVGFFLAYWFYSIVQGGDEGFYSILQGGDDFFPFTRHQALLPGVTV